MAKKKAKKTNKKAKKTRKVTAPPKKTKKPSIKLAPKTSTLIGQTQARLDSSINSSLEEFRKKASLIKEKNDQEQEELVQQILGEREHEMPNYFHDIQDDDDTLNDSGFDLSDDGEDTFKSSYDIFEFAQKKLEAVGDYPVFSIHRDGEQYPSRYGRYSWDQLQKDLGGGHYTIWAKSKATGRIVKKESRQLAGEPKDIFKKDEPKHTPEIEVPAPIHQKDEYDKLLALAQIMSMNNKNDASAALIAKSNNDSTTTMMTTIMTQVQEQGRQFQTMLMEIQKSSIQAQERAQQDALRREEKLQERFEKLMDKVTNKKDDFSLKDILDLQSKAMDKGYISYKTQMDMAKEIAEELADKDKEESPFSSIVKSFAPIVVSGLQQAKLPNPQPSPMDQQRSLELARRYERENQERERQAEIMKKRRLEEESKRKAQKQGEIDLKTKTWNIAAAPLLTHLQETPLNGRNAAISVLKSLNAEKITSQVFLQAWPTQDMMKVADELGIVQMAKDQGRKEEFDKFIKDFYEFFEEKSKKSEQTSVGFVKPDITEGNSPSQSVQPS